MATKAKYVRGKPCPHCRVRLEIGTTARLTAGGHVQCVALARERSAAWQKRNPSEKPEREAPVSMPAPDPRWDRAEACALSVPEDGLYAACVVAPARFASREEAEAAAERALREVRSARARGDRGDD